MSTDQIDPDVVTIFSDGSCYPNPNGPGGWAYVAMWRGKYVEAYGHIPCSTNNLSELTAIYEALSMLRVTRHDVHLWTDSQYAKNAVTVWWPKWERAGWLNAVGLPVANAELVKRIVARIDDLSAKGGEVKIRYLKGHAGHVHNERADDLAGMARVMKPSSSG